MDAISTLRSLTPRRPRGLSMLATALLFGMLVSRADAQLTTGTVSGSVHDPHAAAVPSVAVTLISESRGTRLADVLSNSTGDFVVPNVPPDTYTLQISQQGFKMLRRTGIAVSPGDRVGLGPLTLEVGAVSEAVTVTAEATLLQTQSAERSFTIMPQAVQNLPIANRSFASLAELTPGVSGTSRIGDRANSGGGDTNVMMDGVSTMDTGNNGFMFVVNTESVEEVKILVSNYQAEYGRSSGLQISSVTKSGSNHFHGSGFLIMRKDRWNSISKTTLLNGDARTNNEQKDLGYSIGGPIGRPGRNNKLFFFYSHEYDPRTTAGGTIRYRFPTALERAGDFSQTLDNQGNPFPYIKDPLLTGACSASNTAGCFRDGGVLGRIPANRLYQPGLKILSLYPLPNLPDAPGVAYNWEGTRKNQSMMSQEPIFKVDYQPLQKLRASFKLALWGQPNQVTYDTLPGFNDSQQYKAWFSLMATTINYSISPTMFLEGTFGRSRNDLAGCVQGQGATGPTFCTSGLPVNDIASLKGAGLTGLPSIFPDAGVIDKSYYAYEALQAVKPPIWDGTRLSMVPSFSWGGRVANAPPNFPFPGWLNVNKTTDIAISMTKVAGRHTLKSGFYNTHSYKAQQRQGWAGSINFGNDTQNSLDSGFGFSNAALGVFSSYNQYSRYVEGNYLYNNTEGYVQDNWKLTRKLTLDYGVRLVHQQPQYDILGQGVNFLPDKWTLASAPVLYGAGCAAQPCTGANRQAMDPRTGQLLGPNTSVAIGTLVPGSGNPTNGLFVSGKGIPNTTYNWPTLVPAPRFGVAYDVTGKQKLILRGGGGLFFDRPAGNSIYSQVQNPPTLRNVTLRYSQLQTMGGLTTEAAPTLNVYQLDSGLPSTWNWNAGVQYMLPFATALDFSYTGQHSYNLVEDVNINTVDFGAAFLPANQDPTVTSTIPGGAAVSTDLMRAYRGYGGITQEQPRGWYTSHTLQLAITRRFTRGLSFGFNDTILLQSKGSTGARLQHNPDGTFFERADQTLADDLLGNFVGTRHRFKGNVVWDIPGIKNGARPLKWLSRDWRLSGIWTANTGSAYTIGTSFQNGAGNQNITGSPNYGYRTRVIGNPGSGCDTENLYRQFNTGAFAPPLVGSVGLESGQDYLRGCSYQQLDLALTRSIRLGESRRLEFRLDAFNAPNQDHITGRNTNMNVASQTDATITNLPFDTAGNLIATRSQPKNAAFGVANGYQGGRSLQAWIRFVF
jgi:hypothetical protein